MSGPETARDHATIDLLPGDVAASAVLVSWDPSRLHPYSGLGVTPPEPGLIDRVSIHLRSGQRQLRDDVRTRVLARLGLEGARAARQANLDAPSGDAQELFDALLTGTAPPPAEWKDVWIAAGPRVVGWCEALVGLSLPSGIALAQIRARKEILSPLRAAADRLRGQQTPLQQILSWFKSPSAIGQPLLVHGIGGSGKSTLVARAFVDRISAGAIGAYLDFDSVALDLNSLPQVEAGLESIGPDPRLDAVAREIARQLGALHDNVSYYLFARAVRDVSGLHGLLNTLGGLPLLLAVDTLEELQYAGPEFVSALAGLFEQISADRPHLRILLAGRAPAPELTERVLAVPSLEPEVAQRLLCELVLKQGGALTSEQAERLVRRIGTFPLHLVVAAYAVSEEPALCDEVETRRLEGRVAAGFMYRRILQHIHDVAVRAATVRALALRRLDAGLLGSVILPDSPGDVNDPQLVLAELGREVALTRRTEDGVVFRPEVRRLVLDGIKAELRDEWIHLHRRAAAVWADRAAVTDSLTALEAHAEAQYHRLVLWEDPERISADWQASDGPLLVDAIEESVLPSPARTFLVERTANINGDVVPGLGRLRVVAQTLRTAEQMLVAGRAEDAILALEQAGVLDDPRAQLLAARSLHARGQSSESLACVASAERAALVADDEVTAHEALLLSIAWLEEGGRIAEARERVEAALERHQPPIRALRLLDVQVRLGGPEYGPQAAQLCEEVGPAIVARDPALLRRLLEWVPSGALLREGLRTFGLDGASQDERTALLGELEAWQGASNQSGHGLESLASRGRVTTRGLYEIFIEMFSVDELSMFVRSYFGRDIEDSLPGRSASFSQFSVAVVHHLESRGLVGEQLRQALIRERPRRVHEINAVFAGGATIRSGKDLATAIGEIYDQVHEFPPQLVDRLRVALTSSPRAPSIDGLALVLDRVLPEATVRAQILGELGLTISGEVASADAILDAARRGRRVADLIHVLEQRSPAFAVELAAGLFADLAKRFERLIHTDPTECAVAVAELREALDRGAGLMSDPSLRSIARSLWARPLPALREIVTELLHNDAPLDELRLALIHLAGFYDPHWGLAEIIRYRSWAVADAAAALRELRRLLLGRIAQQRPTIHQELADLAFDSEALHHRIASVHTHEDEAAALARSFLRGQPETPDLFLLVRHLECQYELPSTHPALSLLLSALARRTFELPGGRTSDPWLRAAQNAARSVVTVGRSRHGRTAPGTVVCGAWFDRPDRPLVLALMPDSEVLADQRVLIVIVAFNRDRTSAGTAWSAECWPTPEPQSSFNVMPGEALVLLDVGDVVALSAPERAMQPTGSERIRLEPDVHGGPATRFAVGNAGSPYFDGPPAPGCCPIFDEDWRLVGVHLGSEDEGYSQFMTIDALIEAFRR